MSRLNGGLSPKRTIGGRMLTNDNGDISPALAGYQYEIDTLTHIAKDIIEQKFYRVAPADFIPIEVGEGAYMDSIVRNVSFQSSGSFFDGDVDTNSETSRVAQTNVNISPIDMPLIHWNKVAAWSNIDLEKATRTSNWDVLSAKLEALKTSWDLGIQEVAFLGHPSIEKVTGLLNDSEVTVNTSLIDKPISNMNSVEFQAFVGGLLSAYIENTLYTENSPNMFVMPAKDYAGIVSAASDRYPNMTKLQFLRQAMVEATGEKDFAIKPLAYCQANKNDVRSINKNRYVMYKKDPKTMKMAIPMDFTFMDAEKTSGSRWAQEGQGQYSGVLITRKREVLYFDRP